MPKDVHAPSTRIRFDADGREFAADVVNLTNSLLEIDRLWLDAQNVVSDCRRRVKTAQFDYDTEVNQYAGQLCARGHGKDGTGPLAGVAVSGPAYKTILDGEVRLALSSGGLVGVRRALHEAESDLAIAEATFEATATRRESYRRALYALANVARMLASD